MDNFSEDSIILNSFFVRALQDHESGPKALGWGSETSQKIRFRILCEIGNLNGKNILDFGCGFGDLYGFFTENGKKNLGRYVGVDMNPFAIEKARQKYQGVEFRVGDYLALKEFPEGSFDYVVASGVFNIEIPHWQQYTYASLLEMYRVCKNAVGINFLNAQTILPKSEGSHYTDPCELLKFANSNLNFRSVLRQDYWPNDFTMYIYKCLAEQQ